MLTATAIPKATLYTVRIRKIIFHLPVIILKTEMAALFSPPVHQEHFSRSFHTVSLLYVAGAMAVPPSMPERLLLGSSRERPAYGTSRRWGVVTTQDGVAGAGTDATGGHLSTVTLGQRVERCPGPDGDIYRSTDSGSFRDRPGPQRYNTSPLL